MIVVADTGPLNYLILIGHAEILQVLYQRVLLPVEVRDELLHPNTPINVRTWVSRLPDWCEVIELQNETLPSLSDLDAGERSAIQLALEINAEVLLIDDREGRLAAVQHGLAVRGTLGVLKAAHLAGHIDLYAAVVLLLETNFNISISVLEQILRID